LLALALLVVFETAQTVAAATLAVTREVQKDVMVTIYNGNLGLVKDVREVRLPLGLGEAQFMDVASQIDPTTVHLKSLSDPAGLKILEQNYEYDLLSSEKLLENTSARPCACTSPRHLHEPAAVHGRPVFEINGQIHLATRAGWCCRLCPTISWPDPRWCGCCATRWQRRSGSRRPT
jgi:hypothetical protein